MPDEQKIFKPSEGELILSDEGNYELIKQGDTYLLGLQRYYFADYYGEEIKKITLTEAQFNLLKSIGKEGVDDFVAKQRLLLWVYQPIWVVAVKAKVESAACSIAMDGSDFYIYYSCVPADNSKEAIDKLIQYLESDFLSAIQIYEIKLFTEAGYSTNVESDKGIIENAKLAFERQKTSSFIVAPCNMTSLLITPQEIIVSKWHCDYDYWSKRVDAIEYCEFFPDKELCFQRMLELEIVSADEKEAYDALADLEDNPMHYKIIFDDKIRFEKIDDLFEADWQYAVEKKGDGFYLKVQMGKSNQIVEMKLVDYQENRYEREGMEYILGLIKRL